MRPQNHDIPPMETDAVRADSASRCRPDRIAAVHAGPPIDVRGQSQASATIAVGQSTTPV